ncbi:hypothetical protein [Rickettsia felis]|uniref:hypothetical protein n=1 Tax=Rickettsia felis TaxID=42862 RepID=UPI0012E02D78|nr:hypothetical protein [Rickettsia felis]
MWIPNRHCEEIYNSKLTKQSWDEFLRLPRSLTFARNDDETEPCNKTGTTLECFSSPK